jgi:glycosyltransferase involved in cell wall biosynthesis
MTIIVPTYNRGRFLPHLLEALAALDYPAELVELVLVDDGSTDGTPELLAEWADRLPFAARFERAGRQGAAAARNKAAALARGDVLAFTDSDCMPEPGWLRGGARALGLGATIACGPIEPRRLDGTHWLFNAQLNRVTSDTGLYPTANLFIRRAAFTAAGGFREDVVPWAGFTAGEDTDLAWRIKREGKLALFEPTAAIVHLATPLSRKRWLQRPLILSILPRLLRDHPELRESSLWFRYFLSRPQFYFDLAALGVLLAAALRWWPPLLLGAPWLYVVFRAHLIHALKRNPIKAAALFVLIGQQFTLTLLTLLAASIRYRRLVL